MRPAMRQMFRRLINPARSARRRGTIIVLALGVLAILAVAAVSYVAIVRGDRESAAAAQRDINVQQQVNAVANEIRNLLTADLFGNKIVTRDVPADRRPAAFEDGEFSDRPSVFGPWAINPDGSNNPASPAQNDTARVVYADSGGVRGLTPTDDAWLAPTEPVIDTATPANSFWPSITNLRSAYRFAPSARGGTPPDRWVRDDGRYVDLLNFFLFPNQAGYANPNADLTIDAANATYYNASVGADRLTIPGSSTAISPVGPSPARGTRVYAKQVIRTEDDSPINLGVEPHQERRWADTDGDLRPDARWQQLDALGTAFGLKWVVAARIIDASSLVNFNTATLFPYRNHIPPGSIPSTRDWAHIIGTGATPADVDLLRLVGNAAPYLGASELSQTFGGELAGTVNIWPVGLFFTRFLDGAGDPSYRRMLARSMGFGPLIRKLGEDPPPLSDQSYEPPYDPLVNVTQYPGESYPGARETAVAPWSGLDVPTIAQRAAWYYHFGSDPTSPTSGLVSALPLRDAIDLFAFWGTNNTTVTSRIEQFTDGTEANGFLPGTTSPGGYGPLRAREGTTGQAGRAGELPRRFGEQDESSPDAGLPTLSQLKYDTRHLLTPVSGAGTFSPIPVLNASTTSTGSIRQPSYFDGQSTLPRISLPRLEQEALKQPNAAAVSTQDVQRVFDAFTWALAPLATDKPLARELTIGSPGLFNGPGGFGANAAADSSIYHYGGTLGTHVGLGPEADGPAKILQEQALSGADPKASFAVAKALALTVNLFDALDVGTDAGPLCHLNESPTVVRLFNTPTDTLSSTTAERPRNVHYLGTRMPQGSIPKESAAGSSLLPELFGQRRNLGSTAGSVTAVGIDRHPFIVQASSYAFYEDADSVTAPSAGPKINPLDPEDQIGSVIAFELRNPWAQAIDLREYKVAIGRPDGSGFTRMMTFSLDRVIGGSTVVLDPGQATVFYYARGPAAGAPSAITDAWDAIKAQLDSLLTTDSGSWASLVIHELTATSPYAAPAQPPQNTDDALTMNLVNAANPSVVPPANESADPGPIFISWILQDAGGTIPNPQPRDIPVVLIRKGSDLDVNGNPVASVPPRAHDFDIVVDRLSPPVGATDVFPAVQLDDFEVTAFQTQDVGTPPVTVQPLGRVRLARASSIYRPTTADPASTNPSAKGFPAYVIERRAKNTTEMQEIPPSPWNPESEGTIATTHKRAQAWRTASFPVSTDFTADTEPLPAALVIASPGGIAESPVPPSKKDKGPLTNDSGATLKLGFQLFSPTDRQADASVTPRPSPLPKLRSPADLLLLPAVATLYIHPNRTSAPEVADALDLTTAYDTSNPAKPVLKFGRAVASNLGVWATASEQLGSDWELFRTRGQAGDATGETNPFLGMLDTTRSVLSIQAPGRTLPRELSIPLALRVPMPFDGVNLRTDFASGRINLNTAPRRVLKSVPFLSPLGDIDNADDAAGTSHITVLPDVPSVDHPLLANWFLPYRGLNLDQPGAASVWDRVLNTNVPGLRFRPGEASEPGMISPAELSLMARWQPGDIGRPQAPATFDDVATAGYAIVGANGLLEKGVPFGRPIDPNLLYAPESDPQDDQEERLALYRGAANSVETRSDVFLAWFVIRGYDPDLIESIQVGAPNAVPTEADAILAMDQGKKFQPTVETRWLAVLDRSNVRSPLDRPRVLLLVELPSANP